MRNVLKNTDQVFHYWANMVQPSGRCGNVSFDGTQLYSYRAIIANIVRRAENGDPATPAQMVLLNERAFSMTTTSHKNGARRATALRTIDVADPAPGGLGGHHANLESIAAQVQELMGKAKRARQNKSFYEDRALRRVNDFNAYAGFYGLPNRFQAPADAAAFMAAAEERRAESRAEIVRVRAERQRQHDEKLAESLAEWRRNECTNGYLAGLSRPALRLSADGTRIETTMGAEIPVEHAKRLWIVVDACRRHERDSKPKDGVAFHLGVYRLTEVRANGDVLAGCHDIPYAEIEGIAKALGLLAEVAA